MRFAARNLVLGPALLAAVAGVRIGETSGWLWGAAGAYCTLALAEVVTLAWVATHGTAAAETVRTPLR